MSTPSMKEIASKLVAYGWFVFPLGVKSKIPDSNLAPKGFQSASNDLAQIESWWTTNPNANIGIDLGRSNLTVLDFDKGEPPAELDLQKYFQVKTARGTHVYFTGTSKQSDMHFNGAHVGEIKSAGGYVLAPFCIHPDGPIYTLKADGGVNPLPSGLLEKLAPVREFVDASPNGAKIPRGRHDTELHRIAGKLRFAGLEEEAIYNALVEIVEKRCENYGLDDYKEMCRKHAFNIVKKPVGTDGSLEFDQKPDSQQIPSQAILIPDEDPDWEFDITPKEYEHQMENEFPVLPLKPGHGPTWDDDIMYGIAGDIVRKAAEYCEAHPAGMYLDILVSFGNLVGRDPYFNVSSTSHFANEFMVRVGESSVSRKGTGRDVVNEVLKMIDPQWYSACVLSGFGSAEAIINVIRDDSIQSIRKKNNSFEDILVPGVKDKRLMIREGELASIFQLAGKPESRADVVLRDGWDSKPLNNVVKGKTNGLSNSNACQYPHLSISADTTKQELIRKMPAGAESNGFGNRFLYCYVRRVKYCPNGGPSIDWRPELMRLNEALRNARELKYVGMQGSTRTLWGRMYMEIQKEAAALSGIVASMTARAEPHVRRLALILCLLDGKDAVETYHLHAAKKIWDYCQDSTRYIFGGLTKDQESILSWLRTSGPVTVTQITQQLFYKNRKAGWVRLQVNALISARKVELKDGKVVAKV